MPKKSHYENLKQQLRNEPGYWLVTGVAGFIGSNLLETLLDLGQQVVGLDNFATGHADNLQKVKDESTSEQWSRFTFIEGDICRLEDCQQACKGIRYVLHQAALGSVPRSLEDPIRTNESNVTGFLNMLVAARDAEVSRFVYAASSSTYGDHPELPKKEDLTGSPLSPYALTKSVNEQYASVFSRCYGLPSIGLRYFNVFGRRQDPNGAYAAVIPRWTSAMIQGDKIFINGDGETTRDFCYVDNAVQANLLAATTTQSDAVNQVYNVAVGARISLNDLFGEIKSQLLRQGAMSETPKPVYRDFRTGDVRHSLADISKAKSKLQYQPTHSVQDGLAEATKWYNENLTQDHALLPRRRE